RLGEVQFYFRAETDEEVQAFALIDRYSDPDPEFYEDSYRTLWSCQPGGGVHLSVIPAKWILAVVALVPHDLAPGASLRFLPGRYFLVEQPRQDVIRMG
ncbi:hypothetical protein R3P38DRAFT_2393706, partial [Favolaschia claudopus]